MKTDPREPSSPGAPTASVFPSWEIVSPKVSPVIPPCCVRTPRYEVQATAGRQPRWAATVGATSGWLLELPRSGGRNPTQDKTTATELEVERMGFSRGSPNVVWEPKVTRGGSSMSAQPAR